MLSELGSFVVFASAHHRSLQKCGLSHLSLNQTLPLFFLELSLIQNCAHVQACCCTEGAGHNQPELLQIGKHIPLEIFGNFQSEICPIDGTDADSSGELRDLSLFQHPSRMLYWSVSDVAAVVGFVAILSRAYDGLDHPI